jgi:hypothetical protein
MLHMGGTPGLAWYLNAEHPTALILDISRNDAILVWCAHLVPSVGIVHVQQQVVKKDVS